VTGVLVMAALALTVGEAHDASPPPESEAPAAAPLTDLEPRVREEALPEPEPERASAPGERAQRPAPVLPSDVPAPEQMGGVTDVVFRHAPVAEAPDPSTPPPATTDPDFGRPPEL